MTPSRRSHRKGLKFALQRTQWVLAREIYLKTTKIDSGPFLDALFLWNENKGGADAVGMGGQSPRGGRSGEPEARPGGAAGSPPGCLRPAPEAASGRSFFLPLLGFPPPEALKAFLKVKNARARYGFANQRHY